MSLLGRIFADDEELGKKDDDRKPGSRRLLPTWSARKPNSSIPWQRRKRTVLYGLTACIILYLFFKNLPLPDHPPATHRPQYGKQSRDPSTIRQPDANLKSSPQRPPHPGKPSEAEKHYYDGPIKFYALAVSLRAAASLWGYMEDNRNVLFAASNLKSASELIPIACEMAGWERNDVHFAFMGRDDLDVDEIKILNGVDEQCNVNWHGMRTISGSILWPPLILFFRCSPRLFALELRLPHGSQRLCGIRTHPEVHASASRHHRRSRSRGQFLHKSNKGEDV